MPDTSPLALSYSTEILRPFRHGTIVRLIDGSVGESNWSDFAEVHVIHADLGLGRGPWIFPRCQVEAATPTEAAAYAVRCQSAMLLLVSRIGAALARAETERPSTLAREVRS